MYSEIVQSETPHSFQEPASPSNSSDATGANPTVVFNATNSQNSLNATGIAGGLFYGAKFENATININFTYASKSSSNGTFERMKRVFEASM